MNRGARGAASLLAAAALSAGALSGCGSEDTTAPGPTATIRVTNNATGIVQRFFIRDCDAFQWGQDRLGFATLGVGSSADFEVAAGCHDLRAFVFAGPPPVEEIDTVFNEGVVVDAGAVFDWEISAEDPTPQE